MIGAARGWHGALVCALAGCAPGPSGIALEDVTELAGLAFEREPTEGMRTLPDRFGGGVCVLDVDGEPPMDLFFALRDQSRLFVAHQPLEYADETFARGLADAGDAIGCLAFDAEGDGDDDLLVTGVGGARLFEAIDGRFEDVSARLGELPDAMYTSAAAGDVDGDGALDLAIAGFKHLDRLQVVSCPPIDCAGSIGAHEPAASLLLVRQPDGRYVDRAAELAPEMALAEPTLVMGLARLEGEGPIDIFVGNDLGNAFRDRALRRGSDGVFRDASGAIGLAYNRRGYGVDTMGWTIGDVDGDGALDHVTSSFEGDATAVFVCASDGFCEDEGRERGMDATASTVRWGQALADLDHDGDLDLVEAAGHVYPEDELRALGSASPFEQAPRAYRNEAGVFTLAPELSAPRALRGVALVDLDEDGRVDVVMAPSAGAPLALRNASRGGHWLRVALVGRGANRAAAGAVVRIRAGAERLVRAHAVGEGYLGSFDPRIHVGLPSDAPVQIDVRWPDGSTSSLRDVAVDRDVVVMQ